jgi:hypothetical protein
MMASSSRTFMAIAQPMLHHRVRLSNADHLAQIHPWDRSREYLLSIAELAERQSPGYPLREHNAHGISSPKKSRTFASQGFL